MLKLCLPAMGTFLRAGQLSGARILLCLNICASGAGTLSHAFRSHRFVVLVVCTHCESSYTLHFASLPSGALTCAARMLQGIPGQWHRATSVNE